MAFSDECLPSLPEEMPGRRDEVKLLAYCACASFFQDQLRAGQGKGVIDISSRLPRDWWCFSFCFFSVSNLDSLAEEQNPDRRRKEQGPGPSSLS